MTKEKKNAQKVWTKDLVHEKTFRLSSRTPQYYYLILLKLFSKNSFSLTEPVIYLNK